MNCRRVLQVRLLDRCYSYLLPGSTVVVVRIVQLPVFEDFRQSGQVRCSPVAPLRPMLYHCGGSTERTGERCFSRFNCAGNSTGTLNGLDFSCPCGAAVTPEQPADWCRTSCDSLSPASGLAKPGLCPSTCYDCEGWSSDPVGMW
jgi:hypothetical protein